MQNQQNADPDADSDDLPFVRERNAHPRSDVAKGRFQAFAQPLSEGLCQERAELEMILQA